MNVPNTDKTPGDFAFDVYAIGRASLACGKFCLGYFAEQTRVKKNAKKMLNTKQNCFSYSSASPRNDKQCSAKQCFANQANRCLGWITHGYALATRPYICKRTPTYGDESDKLGARFTQVKNTPRTFLISYANVRIVRNTVGIRPGWKTAKSSNYTSQNTLV